MYRLGIGHFTLFRFFPDWFYNWLHVPYHVTMGLSYHFFFMWVFAINGVAWGAVHLALRRVAVHPAATPQPAGCDPGGRWWTCTCARGCPSQTKYNGAQRIAYTSCALMGAMMLLTGLAIYKPTQLHVLTSLLGGYEMARWLHFWTTMGLSGFLRRPHRAGRSCRLE